MSGKKSWRSLNDTNTFLHFFQAGTITELFAVIEQKTLFPPINEITIVIDQTY